jgi:hypothetical protein
VFFGNERAVAVFGVEGTEGTATTGSSAFFGAPLAGEAHKGVVVAKGRQEKPQITDALTKNPGEKHRI